MNFAPLQPRCGQGAASFGAHEKRCSDGAELEGIQITAPRQKRREGEMSERASEWGRVGRGAQERGEGGTTHNPKLSNYGKGKEKPAASRSPRQISSCTGQYMRKRLSNNSPSLQEAEGIGGRN